MEPELATSCVSQIKLEAQRPLRQRPFETHCKHCDHQHVSSGCVSLALPCMVGCAKLTGISMMKLSVGLDDECVDALLILFAANMQISFFQDWWRVTIFPQLATSLERTSLPKQIQKT